MLKLAFMPMYFNLSDAKLDVFSGGCTEWASLIQRKNGSFTLLEFVSSLSPYLQMFCYSTNSCFTGRVTEFLSFKLDRNRH